MNGDDAWDIPAAPITIPALGPAPSTLHLELANWEGPLDLLLDLARRQKVDLRQISILDLVDQYLAHIAPAADLRLDLAADYLVMAAWLAYLKSALLLPREEQEDPSAEELALRLQLRLARLSAMREAAARLLTRDRLRRDVFMRGSPEGLRRESTPLWQCDLFTLLRSYGEVRIRTQPVVHIVRDRLVMTLDAALARVSALLGATRGWAELRTFLPAGADDLGDSRLHRSALASSFVAALELARLGKAELAQQDIFGPLLLRRGDHG